MRRDVVYASTIIKRARVLPIGTERNIHLLFGGFRPSADSISPNGGI